MRTPKGESVSQEGVPDGFVPQTGYEAQIAPDGETRLLVSVPVERLPEVHLALLGALRPPIAFLYRQKVDRLKPNPDDRTGRDYVALEKTAATVRDAMNAAGTLLWHDARCELWLRDFDGAQVILDQDGVLYAYPDDPSFRDVLEGLGLSEGKPQTMVDRDYVKHWYHAENDAVEAALIQRLGLTEMRPQR